MYVVGSRVLLTRNESGSLCDVHEEGSFMAQCGFWHRMEKKTISLHNSESEGYDEGSEAEMLARELTCSLQKRRAKSDILKLASYLRRIRKR